MKATIGLRAQDLNGGIVALVYTVLGWLVWNEVVEILFGDDVETTRV